MIYDIRHVTTYHYEAPVHAAQGVLRLLPAERPGQAVLAADLAITPVPARRTDARCFFGNRVTTVAIEMPHRELTFAMTARIEVTRETPDVGMTSPAWEMVRDAAWADASLAPEAPAHFLPPSRLVPREPDIEAYGRASFPAGRPVLAGAVDVMERIRAEFAYDPTATLVSTPVASAFAQRRGVCQDFAQIMIGALRGLGLPARYVSGYLRTVPPPGQPRLEGADATHAWADLWCGADLGWIGFDPTNARLVGPDHIVLAVGRDYADIAPINGVLLGSGDQTLDVAVDVIPVEG